MDTITVVVPCYNEEDALKSFYSGDYESYL